MIDNLFSIINYKFRNENLLNEALTRQSAISENIPGSSKNTYQRLEFLGDSVLKLVISDLIFKVFPEKNECEMTNLRIGFEKNQYIGLIAKTIGLGKFLKIGKGEEMQNLRDNTKLLGDIFESVIGAIYIDSNDFNLTKQVTMDILKNFLLKDKNILENRKNFEDYFVSMNTKKNESNNKIESITKSKHVNLVICEGTSFHELVINDFISEFKKSLINKQDLSFKEFICKVKNNLYIDCEIFYTLNSNKELINPELIKNYLFSISQVIKEFFYSLNLKPHYIMSKTLLYLLTFYSKQEPFIHFITIICLAHNGISEYYRHNFEKSKEYLENAIVIIKEEKLRLPEIKLLISYYYSENEQVPDILNDLTIKAFLDSQDNIYSSHLICLISKMKYEHQIRNLMKDNYSQKELHKLYEMLLINIEPLSQKFPISLNLYFKIYFKVLSIKAKISSKSEIDFDEIRKNEEEVNTKLGNSLILENFYRFYLNNITDNEKIIDFYKKLIKLLLEHYTLLSTIITEGLTDFSNFININF